MCPQYTDAPVVEDLTIKLQKSTWYECLNPSLAGSRMYICTYVRTHIRTEGRTFVRTYPCMENQKYICPWHHPMRGHENIFFIPPLIWSYAYFSAATFCHAVSQFSQLKNFY